MTTIARALRVSEFVVCADLEDEAVLLNVETGIYFGLDATGARIWKLLEAGHPTEEIVSELIEVYDVAAPQLRLDVARFLAELEAYGLARADDA